MEKQRELDSLCINTIRMLSADAVEKANSGHPGLPMGAAAFSYVLWTKFLRYNPTNPAWLDRDRFVLSAGHGSMLLYSLLHLTGYDLPLAEIKQFRQWGSKTPGHPEFGLTPGVETTTGPLGQGFANGVGMGIAQKVLADRYNKPHHKIIDYSIFALVSDGDLMEGISSEAASYAGSLKLGNLVYLYDSNHISIEGSTKLTFCEDTAKRFKSYGWHVQQVKDGNDLKDVATAIRSAKNDPRPSIIVLHTHIGFGSPHKQDSAAAHGAALGKEELALTKKALNWPESPDFHVPLIVKKRMLQMKDSGVKLERAWRKKFSEYESAYPELARELLEAEKGVQSDEWKKSIPDFSAEPVPMATREASGKVMNAIAPALPLFVGGSADLAPSNNSALKEFGDIKPGSWEHLARNLHFGIREHAMGGIMNGISLFPGFITYGATFLCFSDYMRASIRLAAIMKLGNVYIFTHDSIGQGEDGTTHQPIEHLASLRAMPNLTVIRPADSAETAEAWKFAIEHRHQPTALILTRQKLPYIRDKVAKADGLRKGGYILKDCTGKPQLLLIATGSEVYLTIEAAETLSKSGVKCRVISMPSTELFDQQSQTYKESVLPHDVSKRIIIEAASPFGWEKYAGTDSVIIGIQTFGESAPGPVMMEKYGFTVDNIVARANQLLGSVKGGTK